MGEYFPDNVQQDYPVVIAFTAISFVLVQGDGVTASHALGNIPCSSVCGV